MNIGSLSATGHQITKLVKSRIAMRTLNPLKFMSMKSIVKADGKNRLSSIVSRLSTNDQRLSNNESDTATPRHHDNKDNHDNNYNSLHMHTRPRNSSLVSRLSSFVFRTTNNDQRTTILSLLTVFFLLITSMGWGQTYYDMSSGNYSQNFADMANWTNNYAAGSGANNWKVAATATGSTVNAGTVFASTTSGGVQKGTQSLIILATGTNSSATDLLLNFSGRTAGTLSLDWVKVVNTANASPRSSDLKIQYSTDGGSNFTDITGYTIPRILNNSTAESGSLSSITLPEALNNQSTVVLRFYVWNNSQTGGSGNRPKWQLDNISVTSTAALSNDANLSALSLSSGTLSPTFSSATTSYTASVANAVSSITVTPTQNQANATITVNGVSVTSGNASGNISLNVGDNTITVIVTAQDGSTKTYTVTVTRAAAAGANADLSALSLSTGTLSPTFAAATTSYAATVSNATSSVTVTPTLADATASVSVRVNSVNSGDYNGVTSGSASSSLALNVGSNTIDVRVTAQDGTTIKTYTITVTRQSNDATLSALTISAGTLSPSFASGITTYTTSVTNATTTVTVTPTRNQANATITVNGVLVTSGNASGNISLSVGSNTINVLVTAQDNSFTQTYTITVTRAASSVSTLLALTISSGTLSPTFASGTNAYTASVANATGSVTVTPTVTQANATIQVRVNSDSYASVNSGSASGSLSLNEGSNTISVLVTAQDNATTTTYTITVTRLLDYINITALNTAVTEDFNTLASSGTSSTLPQGWFFSESGGNSTYAASTGSGSTGDTYSFGAASSTERALGGILSGSVTPTIGAKITNNTGSSINTLTISYTGETWRVIELNRSDRLDFQYSLNATSLTTGTWVDVDALDYANPGQATGNGSVQHSSNISGTISSLSIANGATIWIRWNDFNATGSDDGMAIDDFSITASVSATAPTLTAAANATVDGPFTLTFSDNSAWRTAISSITVGGTTLDASAYSISSGQIAFTPSASALLQSSGSKSIAVLANGYTNATVTQTIGVGAATQLVITTQPAAPATNGGSLATQPIVAIRDQYNNTLTGSSASVTAAVGSSGTWILGGTKTINASSGVATFSGLTASNSTSVTDATILFTSGALSVTSSSFNIPAPAPANNNCGSATTITLNATAISGTLDGATVISPFSGKIDVWYKFVPSCSGTQTVTVSGFTGDVDVELFEGSLCPSTTSFLDNSAGSTSTESITGSLTSGTTYYVRVLAFDATAQTSTFSIAVTEANCPSPVLNAPVAGTATLVYNNGFQANWSSATDATGYRLDVSTAPIATDLFISEYVEGSSNNKYIEIYNGTGRSIELSDYRLMLFVNGGTTPTNNILLSGTLASGSVIVYKNSSAALSLPQGVTAADNAAIAFNGDDAIALFKISSNSYVDIFGNIGEDPGIAWTATNTTLDRTLRRKSTVTGGVTTNPASGFSTLATEWDQFIENTVSGLGSHTSNANPSFVTGFSNLSVNDTKLLVTGLNANTTYYYVVRSTDATRTSSNSNIITVTTANSQAGPLPNIWVGEMNGSWNNAANWSYGTIPSSTGNTLIDDGTPLLDIDFTLASTGILTLADNGSLVIGAGKTLSIAGSADFGDRPVTLKSTSTGTAAIGQVTGTLSNATAVTVERYVQARRKWRALTTPLTGSSNNSIFYNWQNNGSINGGGAIIWSPSASTGVYQSAAGTGSSMISYNSAANNWSAVTNTQTSLLFNGSNNNAYMTFVTGPYNTNGNYVSGSSGSAATTLRATGSLRQGDVVMPNLAGNNQFVFVGNPYASAINLKNVAKTGYTNFAYTWNPSLNALGGYVTINTNSGTDASNTIESGQAFFMQANNATNSLSFEEADKVSSLSNVGNFRTSESGTPAQISIDLNKYVNGSLNKYDNATCDFVAGANPGLDGDDALKPTQFYENMSIYRLGKDLSWETRPDIMSNDTLQLRMWAMQQANYQVKLNLSNFRLPTGAAAVLQDLYLSKETTLNLSGVTLVDFTVNADATSTGQRFRVVFRNSAVTPVTDLNGQKGFNVYPNPVVKGTNMQLEFRNRTAGKYTVTIFTIAGVQVQQDIVTHGGGTAVQSLKLSSQLSSGTYIAEISGANGVKEKVKVVVE